jgi:hypothetical protein
MRIARLIALGLGVLALLGAGVATVSRGGQPKQASVAERKDPSVQRNRLVELESDVDLLQLQFDAVRATLLETLKKEREQVPQCGAEQTEMRSAAQIRSELEKFQWMVVRSPVVVGDEQFNTMIKELKQSEGLKMTDEEIKLFKELLEGSATAKEALVRIELKARLEGSRRAIDQQKQEFARLSRMLNEKKLDLAEAERVYQRETR